MRTWLPSSLIVSHAQPHLLTLGSLDLLPPDPSVKIVMCSPVGTHPDPRASSHSHGPNLGVVHSLGTRPLNQKHWCPSRTPLTASWYRSWVLLMCLFSEFWRQLQCQNICSSVWNCDPHSGQSVSSISWKTSLLLDFGQVPPVAMVMRAPASPVIPFLIYHL